MNHIGTLNIETERLLLRRFMAEDRKSIFQNWASNPNVSRYLTHPPVTEIQEVEALLTEWISGYVQEDYYHWIMIEKQSGKPIGSIGLMHLHMRDENAEVGYCIGEKWWNRGYATEAFSAVIQYGFEQVGLRRIMGRHHIENIASGRVMEKCGMQCEGTFRKVHRVHTGEFADYRYYSILADEFHE